MKSWLYLALVALPLGGCVLPPAVSIASLAFDVGSFAATGKSATDHVISGIAGEDCRMLGVFEGEICREEQEFEAAVANLEPLRPLPEETAAAGGTLLAEGRRAPIAPLPVEPTLDLQPQAPPLQLAAAGPGSDASALTGLHYLAAGLPRQDAGMATATDTAAAALLTPRPAPGPAVDAGDLLTASPAIEMPAARRAASNPQARQMAALAPVAEEVQPQGDVRGLVYGEDGQVLGIAYAFQNPLAGMDGNRESLNRHLSLIDR